MASVYHLLNRQIPAHIREQYPVFCKFIEYYYRWLQTRGFDKLEKVTNIDYECHAITVKDCFDKLDNSVEPTEFVKQFVGYTIVNDQGVVAEIVGYDDEKLLIRYLTEDAIFELNDTLYVRNDTSKVIDSSKKYDRANVSLVETLSSAYIDHFMYLLDSENLFDRDNSNIALILKYAKQLYQSKGSEQALKYVLKATKDIDSDIRYPWKQVLKPSDGKWKRHFAVNIAVDSRTWYNVASLFYGSDDEAQLPLDTVWVEVPSEDEANPEYAERTIVKVEIFGSQSENYDAEEQAYNYEGWWRRADDREDDGTLAGLDWEKLSRVMTNIRAASGDENYVFTEFPFTGTYPLTEQDYQAWSDAELSYPITYGQYGVQNLEQLVEQAIAQSEDFKPYARSITPYIRIYFEDDPNVVVGQSIQIREQLEDGNYLVRLSGHVTSGVKGFDIEHGGKMWQVGQIFTASKQSLWKLYNPPRRQVDEEGYDIPNSIKTNEQGVTIQYSTDVPLIGRVTSVDDFGAIQSAEIVQLGDHVPLNSEKVIEVSPLFNDTIDDEPYVAKIKLRYGAQTNVLGMFEDSSGMLSNNSIRLQDNYYYQKFSYDIVANADPTTYIELAEKLHPAGSKMFTTYVMESELDGTEDINVSTSNPVVRVSLFDIAIVTDKLTKRTTKRLRDEQIVNDFLMLTFKKVLRDDAYVRDDKYDRVYSFARDYSYDNRAMPYFERVIDYDTHTTQAYCDIGITRHVFFNYEYQTIPSSYKELE